MLLLNCSKPSSWRKIDTANLLFIHHLFCNVTVTHNESFSLVGLVETSTELGNNSSMQPTPLWSVGKPGPGLKGGATGAIALGPLLQGGPT